MLFRSPHEHEEQHPRDVRARVDEQHADFMREKGGEVLHEAVRDRLADKGDATELRSFRRG